MMKIGEILDRRGKELLSEARTPSQKEIETHALSMAKKYNVPFDIIMRHMWVESRYKTKARSEKDAYGLMQLMPKTAKGLRVNRDNWQQNIEGGAKYLRNIKRRLNKKASSLGVKGFKNPWHLVAMRYFTGERRFNQRVFSRAQRQKKMNAYVDQDGIFDTVRYMRDQVANRSPHRTERLFTSLLSYASAVHDPNHRIQRSRLKRHPTYTIPVPKEHIHSSGLEDFGQSPTGTDGKTTVRDSSAAPTVIYIGDSTTGGMARHMKKVFKKNGVNAHVFHVNGAGAALMHTMVTGRFNKWSSKYDKAKREKAMSIAAKIANLKAQGPVSIRINTLGGNDRFRVGSEKSISKYVENYVKPLFKMVDEVGGSGRSKTYDADLKNKAIDEKYRAAAEEVGTPYYSARGADGKPQSFGSPWAPSEQFPWREKQGITAYYRRQAEERIKFSLSNKNIKFSPDQAHQPEKKFSFKPSSSPKGRFLRSYKSFLKKNPNFNFDKFYKNVETHLGSVAYAMPKHGSDYIFGPEHMRTWKALQKKKSAASLDPDIAPSATIGPVTKEKEQELIDKTLAPPTEPTKLSTSAEPPDTKDAGGFNWTAAEIAALKPIDFSEKDKDRKKEYKCTTKTDPDGSTTTTCGRN